MSTRDEGSASVLTIGLVAVLLATILTVTAATQIHLQRLRLQHVADEVALAAADALDVDGYYAGDGAADGFGVSAARLQAEAATQLAASSARQGLEGVRLSQATATGDQVAVTVALRAPVMFGLDWLPGRVDMTAVATARAQVG